MEEDERTRKELAVDLTTLRRQIAELNRLESDHGHLERCVRASEHGLDSILNVIRECHLTLAARGR